MIPLRRRIYVQYRSTTWGRSVSTSGRTGIFLGLRVTDVGLTQRMRRTFTADIAAAVTWNSHTAREEVRSICRKALRGGQTNSERYDCTELIQVQSPGSKHHSPSRRVRKASPHSNTSSSLGFRENATFQPPRQVKIHPRSEKSGMRRPSTTPCSPTTPCFQAS